MIGDFNEFASELNMLKHQSYRVTNNRCRQAAKGKITVFGQSGKTIRVGSALRGKEL